MTLQPTRPSTVCSVPSRVTMVSWGIRGSCKKREARAASYARRAALQRKAGADMGITAEQLKASLDALGKDRARLQIRASSGSAIPSRGSATAATRPCCAAIVGQQVSIKAAAAILARVEAATGGTGDPANIARTSDEDLRAAGLSRQKIAYVKSLAEDVLSGRLDFHALPGDDEEAIAAMTHVKGIGRWTAEVYLLFAEGRPDIFPAGDLAVQVEVGRILGLPDRPTEKKVRELAEPWRPHRGAAAIFAWHHRHVVPV